MADEEGSKKRNKWKHLKELGLQCRILSFLTMLVFSFSATALVGVCSATLGGKDDEPLKWNLVKLEDNDESGKIQRDNVTTLLTMTVLSFLGAIVSIIMIIATFNNNMWMTIPYWILILAVYAEYLYQLLYFGFCVGKCSSVDANDLTNMRRPSQFTDNVLHGGGGNYIVSSLLVLALLMYAFIPAFGFFLECKAKRAEQKKKKPAIAPPPPPPPPPPAPVPLPVAETPAAAVASPVAS